MLYLKKAHKIRCRRIDLLFWGSYILLILYRVLKTTVIVFQDQGITYMIIVGLLVIRILMMKIQRVKFFAAVVLCPLIFLCLFHTWDPIIPVAVMMLLASKDIYFDDIVRLSFSVVLFLVVITVVLALSGILEDITTLRYIDGIPLVCHGAGFNHNSKLPTYYCFLFFEHYYLKKGKVKIFELIIWMTGGGIIFLFCGERLRFCNLIVAVLFVVSSKFLKNKCPKLKKLVSISVYPMLCLITNCLGYFYDASNTIMYGINLVLSNRLYLQQVAFNHYGITLFGQRLKMGEEALVINRNLEYFYLDSGYAYIFVVYGIFVGLLILAVYIAGSYKSFKMSNTALLIWFVCMAIDSMVGNQMLSIWVSPLPFVSFCICHKKNQSSGCIG